MANYGYIYLKHSTPIASFRKALKEVVASWFKGGMVVEETTWRDGGPVWWVYIPNSAPSDPLRVGKADNEDFGFAVALQNKGKTIAFRHHTLNGFEYWAQGCIEEMLSEYFKQGITYDATGRTTRVGPRSYRCRSRYGSYVARSLKKPLSEEHRAWVEQEKAKTPEGWW